MSESKLSRPASRFDAALDQARADCECGNWLSGYDGFRGVANVELLAAPDLELQARCAYMLGRDADFVASLDSAYTEYIGAKNFPRATRCAFWIGLTLVLRGHAAQASGWLGRASRALSECGDDCSERGYLLLPVVERFIREGDFTAAVTNAREAASIGERNSDVDLVSLARHLEGRIEIGAGNVEKGLALLDEVMVAVALGELTPIVTGLIYCNVIAGCQQVYAVERAHEWTLALSDWCSRQPSMVAFTGKCLIHRAEILTLRGDWDEALQEAERAAERSSNRAATGSEASAIYLQAELFRLTGRFSDAEAAYQRVNSLGREAQPGLALLRAAEGRTDIARRGLDRALASVSNPLVRAPLVRALVDICVLVDDVESAGEAATELRSIAERFSSRVLKAMSSQAEATLLLHQGEATAALAPLRSAVATWESVHALYDLARGQLLIARTCRMLEDVDGYNASLQAAKTSIERLGHNSNLRDLVSHLEGDDAPNPRDLSDREVQVLRLVAAGKTNKDIAAELYISPKTVDRHVSNIFDKVDVQTRTAAAAFAFHNGIV